MVQVDIDGTQLRQCLKGNFTGNKVKKKNELSIQLKLEKEQ